MSGQSQPETSLQEVFIRLRPDPASVTAAIDRTIKAIEARGGRILMGYPPGALVAELPKGSTQELPGPGDVESVHTDPFSEEQMNAELSDMRFAMMAWNSRCEMHNRGETKPFGQGLSWDAPGMLPPDPPAHVREEFRRREKEMKPDDSDA